MVIGPSACYGASGSCSRPAVSGRPWTRLNAWIAWPAAPLTRLSIDADGEDPAGPLVEADEDPDVVAAGDVLRRRRRRHDRHERLVGVGRRVEGVELGLADRAGRPDVAGRQDAAGHRDEVGQEVDGARARVGAGPARAAPIAASSCSISATWRWPPMPYAFTLSLTSPNMQVRLRLAAGARDAALGVDDEVADQAGARERREREERGRRVAAGRADDRLAARRRSADELGPVELGQAVDGAVESRSGRGCSKPYQRG